MNFVMVPLVMAIITIGVYKLFELFVCKKERLMMIEKMGEKFVPSVLPTFKFAETFSFSALKIGSLLGGMGLGLLIGYLICINSIPQYLSFAVQGDKWYLYRDIVAVVYGACVLLFGGLGLIIAFVAELKLNKK